MTKRSKKRWCGRGFTMVELVTTMALVGVIALVVGTLLVYSQKNWNALMGRVYRPEATDSFVARSVFDTVCRKASHSKALLSGNKTSLELYYWDSGSTADTPENYARFYLSGQNLMVTQGKNKAGNWTPDTASPSQDVLIAAKVGSVQFDVQGASVQMYVNYTDAKLTPVMCSAVRQNY